MYTVIILCAGSGTRTGLSYNKMFYTFKGKSVYEMTLENFISDERCEQVIVVTKESEQTEFKSLYSHHKIDYVVGGNERQDSVYEGLKKARNEYVLIHDGARPYVKKKHIDALLKSLKEHSACLLMVPCKDTIKEVNNGKIVKTLKRESLMQAQTPQAFHLDVIKDAYIKGIESHFQATDDAQMVEEFTDKEVYVVVGDYENKKITTQEDLI
ncbi:MAG: 2-C-methyl-D-erythritol 4-phosphate cytidylyltransferase [Coprobacillus sp.]